MRYLLLAVLIAATACATTPSPVPVSGDLAALEGEWGGEYDGLESGRSGSIVFTLVAGSTTAHGDVLMVPLGSLQALRPASEIGQEGDRVAPRVLTISFVQADDGWIRGTLDPYRSPDCGCTLVTTFSGSLTGNRITGTYVTRHQDGTFETGKWNVRRR